MILTDEGRTKLKTILVVQGVSQRELAKAAGWRSHTYMSRLLKGEANTLEAEPAAAIAAYLGVGMDAFFVPRSSTANARFAHSRRKQVA